MANAPTTPMESVLVLPETQPKRSAKARLKALVAAALTLAKNAAFRAYLYCGYVSLRDRVLSLLGRSRIVVLTYHRIGGRDLLSKPTEEFRRDLQWLKQHYECMTLAELHDRLRSNQPIRRPIAVVTFDDGYRDNFTAAVPVLLDEGVPATFFIATGFIGTHREFPHDLRAGAAQPYPKLTWGDLHAMERAGFEVGSHTVNHADLGQADDATAQCELAESLLALSRRLGIRPRAFAFPWGKPANMSEFAIEKARQLGYYAAVSAYGGSNRRCTDPFRLRRIDAGNGQLDFLAFRARVAGFDPGPLRLRLRHGRSAQPSFPRR
ncbi:MAG: polysaccharide deacetylase family protein [Bacillota bacterium]